MNTSALPAYLQNRQSQGVATRATAGMGGVLPPHISIRGNSFTLIDGAGQQQPVGPMMDACVVDISDHMNKRYYENEWSPNSDEPPTCFSMNGIAPSRDSQSPQSPTCAQCQWNVRGSDTSKISGKAIKACRDEKFVALLLPQYPTMLFQLVIPPGSFKNWSAFTQPFLKGNTDISDVLVRFGFQPQVNGVMTFQAVSYIDEATFGAREKALATKATDVLVGRNDIPIALPAPARAPSVQEIAQVATETALRGGFGENVQASAQAMQQVPFGQPAPNAAGTTLMPTAAVSAASAPAVEQPARRKRRTNAEIAADNAAKAAAQAGGSPPPAAAPVQPSAPFPVHAPAGAPGFGQAAPSAPNGPAPAFGAPGAGGFGAPAPAANPGTFGIQNAAEPDPALAQMLASIGVNPGG